MLEYKLGYFATSLCGHDKGKVYMIVKQEGDIFNPPAFLLYALPFQRSHHRSSDWHPPKKSGMEKLLPFSQSVSSEYVSSFSTSDYQWFFFPHQMLLKLKER